jgi:spore maturation protein CgeB
MADFMRQKAGLNAYYLPEGFNPRIHIKPPIEKKIAEEQTGIDLLIYGGLYAYRARMVEQLLKAGIQPVIYGSEGPYCPPAIKKLFRNQYLVGEQKNRLLYGAKIVFNNFHYAEVNSANQKFFEINGIGGFQLCDYKTTLSSYSKVEVETFTYKTIQEAVDKIQYYTSRPLERYKIAHQQYEHFQQEHSFDRRVEEMLRIIWAN